MLNLKNPLQEVAKATLESAYSRVITKREHTIPEWSHKRWLTARDGTSIFSWWYENEQAKQGTMFMLHGFTSNCGNEYEWNRAKAMADHYGLWISAIDFRGHGKSQTKALSFGCAESWDIEAAMNHADEVHAPKPYIIIGESFGGMAAQVSAITDSRVKAVICLQTPGWPWDAIGKEVFDRAHSCKPLVTLIPAVGELTKLAYGFDILTAGDIRIKPSNPEHEPFVLYVMGWNDKYNINHTHEIWDHWYVGKPAEYNKWPADAPNQKKWFIEGDWCHSDCWEQSVMNWDGLDSLLRQFIEHVLSRSR